MPTEAEIRDYLAEHLDLIEDGLLLQRKEYPLPNPTGASGFIDILARDKYGHRVVIEVKRSDKVARSALQELHKYVELLRNNHGLAADKVRCIIASTEWRELLTPFSHFVRAVGYHLEGRRIVLNSEGRPVELLPVEPLPESPELSLCPVHHVFCFADAADRAAAIPLLENELGTYKVADFVAVLMDYVGAGERHSFCLYLVLNRLGPERAAEVEAALGRVDRDYEFYEEWRLEAAVLGHLHCQHTMSVEGGSPETFRNMLTDWRPVGFRRHGILRDEAMVTDKEVLNAVSGLEGTNPVVFSATASPKYAPSWTAVRVGVQNCLYGNSSWQAGITAFLEELGATPNLESVAIDVFNPMCLIFNLWKLHREQTSLFLPHLQCMSQTKAGDTMSILVGTLAWDGKTFPREPLQLIGDIVEVQPTEREVINGLMVYRMMGDLWTLEERFLEAHGLRYVLVEFTVMGGVTKERRLIHVANGRISRTPLEREGLPTIIDFFRRNDAYMEDLSLFLDAHVFEAP